VFILSFITSFLILQFSILLALRLTDTDDHETHFACLLQLSNVDITRNIVAKNLTLNLVISWT
jgi:hypothetical protein